LGATITGTIYTSTDSGTTWSATDAPSNYWASVASSADGNKLVAVVSGGGIYTWQNTPSPVLSLTPFGDDVVISWTIPSMSFVLQQNSDLSTTNWTQVTTLPVLSLTNLQNQVFLSPAASGSAFHRLKGL
jgi:hypothetical protein